jgi:hypothetical protein
MKVGWRYDPASRVFRSSSGEEFAPINDLPRGTKIVQTAPQLAEADPRTLNKDEKTLALFVQVIFTKPVKAERYLERIYEWPCVDTVRPAPNISLP